MTRRGVSVGLLLFSACAAPASPPARTPASTPAQAAAEATGSALNCGRAEDSFGPAILPRDVYAARNGATAQKFSELSTTKQRPLEECGLRTVLERLGTLACDDGSSPFGMDLRMAHASRRGSIGPGGRCDSIIDVYVIRCPERTYEVYADQYFCAAGHADMFG